MAFGFGQFLPAWLSFACIKEYNGWLIAIFTSVYALATEIKRLAYWIFTVITTGHTLNF